MIQSRLPDIFSPGEVDHVVQVKRSSGLPVQPLSLCVPPPYPGRTKGVERSSMPWTKVIQSRLPYIFSPGGVDHVVQVKTSSGLPIQPLSLCIPPPGPGCTRGPERSSMPWTVLVQNRFTLRGTHSSSPWSDLQPHFSALPWFVSF